MATVIIIEDEDEPQGQPEGPVYMNWKDAAVLGFTQGAVLGLFVGAVDAVTDDGFWFLE